MISPLLRGVLLSLALLYAVLGAALFVAPVWASEHFAWKISPFVAMTIGGWCLGTAVTAFIIARRQNWPAMLPPILYLGLFGLFESIVVIAFRDRLLTGTPLAWLYLLSVAATALFAVLALAEAMRQKHILTRLGSPLGPVGFGFALIFILGVGFLGLYGILAVPGMRGLNASIFPEVLSPFSLRAFGSFYFALALAVIPILLSRGVGNVVNHGFAMYSLLVTITAAALAYIHVFDFANRPTQAIYIGIYLLVGLVVGAYLWRYGTGASR